MKKTIMIYLLLTIGVTVLFANFLVSEEFGITLKDYIAYSLPYTKEEVEWLREKPTIYYGADQSSPPLRYLDKETNQYKGVVIDYLSLLSIQMRKDIQFSPYRWDDAVYKLKKGEIDLADMFVSPVREEELSFSIPIYKLRGAVAYRQNIPPVNSKDDLIGKTIAIAKGDYALDYLNNIREEINLIESNNVKEAIKLVAKGQADLVIGDEPVINYYLKEKSITSNVKLSEWSIYESNVVLATAKTNEYLLKIVNKAALKLQKNKEVEKISSKWMGLGSPMKYKIGLQSPSFILFVLVELLGLIILLFFLLTRLLKKEVAIKTKALNRNMQDLEHIFESIPEMKLIINDQYKILNVNHFFSKKINVNKSDMIGQEIYKILELEFLSDISGILSYVFETGELEEKEIKVDQEIYHVSCYPMKQKWEEDKRVIVSFKDVTFQKYDEAQLLQINKMTAIGELASGVAHEIRNPLGLIRSYVYLLKETELVEENKKEITSYLYKIDESTNRAKVIIDNLLNFSRITSDQAVEFNFYVLLEELLSLEKQRVVNNNIIFENLVNKNQQLYLEKESMKHIIINLVSNGIDAMPQGGKLVIDCIEKEEFVMITVADTGIGIDDKNLASLYNPFFTTKENGAGTGLGLYIVYNQVQQLGGHITVESQKDKGTLFLIRVPNRNGGGFNGG